MTKEELEQEKGEREGGNPLTSDARERASPVVASTDGANVVRERWTKTLQLNVTPLD